MRIALILVWLLAGWTALLCTGSARAESVDKTAGNTAEQAAGKETIVIRADRAWEEPDAGAVLHFAGDFELVSPDWQLRGDEADLHGPLDDPERIIARGNPAYLIIIDGDQTIEGQGAVIEYQRDADILILRENAHLSGEDVSMTSSEIIYDVGLERLRSSGTDGVEMVLERAK